MARLRGAIVTGVITIGMIAAVAGCGGSGGGNSSSAAKASQTPAPATPAGPPAITAEAASGRKPAQPPPPGYHWVGGPQSVWLAVPDSWIAVNLAKITLNQAMKRFAVKGSTLLGGSALAKDLKAIEKQHGMMVADLASSATAPHHFTVNLNAFCAATPLELTGNSVTPLIAEVKSQYAPLHPTHLTVVATKIQGAPAIKSEVTLNTTQGMVTDLQYFMIHSSRLCTVTMSTEDPAKTSRTFATIASTMQLPGPG